MPLIDLLRDKWRAKRIERLEGEQSRQRVFEASNAQEKQNACETIAAWLKEADEKAGNPIKSDDEYFSEAQRRIKGFRWQLHRLNRPFLWLEKKVIEPLDFWSDRANLFQFFAKVSPVIEAIGVLAIPFVLFYYENQRNEQQIKIEEQREERQLEFQQNVIASQAEVRQQQAVRDYLSQITTIYLDVENRDDIEQDKDLKNLLEATTLAIFDELSISETLQDKSKDSDELKQEAIEKDRKDDVINFLYKLGWINGDEPLISLKGANLRGTNLIKTNLSYANLSYANLSHAFLSNADLRGTNLIKTNLSYANLIYANLRKAFLKNAFLSYADLSYADLSDADLRKAFLSYADLSDADLRKAFLSYADLSYADLSDADLSYANLRKAYLSDADLSYANLSYANLSYADLINTNIDGAIFCNTTMPNGTINNRDCKK